MNLLALRRFHWNRATISMFHEKKVSLALSDRIVRDRKLGSDALKKLSLVSPKSSEAVQMFLNILWGATGGCVFEEREHEIF